MKLWVLLEKVWHVITFVTLAQGSARTVSRRAQIVDGDPFAPVENVVIRL